MERGESESVGAESAAKSKEDSCLDNTHVVNGGTIETSC